jgi:exopolyphosphatase
VCTLAIDELPIKPNEMSHRIKGIALVDHNVPRSIWDNATVVAIIDHHEDRGVANGTANPRIVEASGSCSSLVTRWLFDNVPGADKRKPGDEEESVNHVHGPLPQELVELLLRTSEFRLFH